MAKIPDFAVRDLKLEAIARLSQEDWNYPELKHPALANVANSFRSNASIVRFMMALPTTIVNAAIETQRAWDRAELEVMGGLPGTASKSDWQKVTEKTEASLAAIAKRHKDWQESNEPGWNEFALKEHLRGAQVLSGLVEVPLGAYGFVHMFSGYITGTWTAIETMLGDLWEAALNAHPNVLASLDGKPKGAVARMEARSSRSEHESKKLDLNLAAKYGFDLRHSMGTIFRLERRFEFTRLSSAREAYLRAFSKKASRVETAIKSDSLEALSVVRNVLLHRAGEADDEYVKHQARLKLPIAAKGEKIKLDGQNTAALIKPAIASSKSLMIAVDDWFKDN